MHLQSAGFHGEGNQMDSIAEGSPAQSLLNHLMARSVS